MATTVRGSDVDAVRRESLGVGFCGGAGFFSGGGGKRERTSISGRGRARRACGERSSRLIELLRT